MIKIKNQGPLVQSIVSLMSSLRVISLTVLVDSVYNIQGSVLSPLLSIIVLEALSREFHSGVPLEDLFADDLVIIAESLEECVRRLLTCKEAMEKKGLRIDAGKTKIMICGTGLDLMQSSGKFPCTICHTGAGSNSIFCNGCTHWVHKKCIGSST